MLAYNRRFVDGLTREQYFRTKECESEIRQKPKAPAPLRMSQRKPTRLNVGCGKLRREGWLNLDKTAAEGVDLVVDLERDRIPLADDSVDEIRGDHVLEHVEHILPAMQELWRVAKPGAKAKFVVPLGKLADADPTHVRRFNEQSWGYFGQPKYAFADYGYRGDWEFISCKREGELMTAVLRAVKPARVA
jgi:SAM-dependent methyltransferase